MDTELLEMIPTLVAQAKLNEKNVNAQDVANNLRSAAKLKDAAPDVLKWFPVLRLKSL